MLLTPSEALVTSLRVDMLTKYWAAWRRVYWNLLSEDTPTCKRAPYCGKQSSQLCQRSLLGSLQQEFQREGIPLGWLLTGDATLWTMSIQDLESSLLRVNLKVARNITESTISRRGLDKSTPVDHTICNPTIDLHQSTNRIANTSARSFIKPSMKKALDRQGKIWDGR